MATTESESTENKKKLIKKCFAPGCGVNAKDDPDKIFFKLPDGVEIRKEWALAVGRVGKHTVFHPSSGVFCCEDHFNLTEDAGNWLDVQRYGARIRLKKGVLPRRVVERKTTDLNSEDHPDRIMPFEFVDVCSFVDETESEQATNVYLH